MSDRDDIAAAIDAAPVAFELRGAEFDRARRFEKRHMHLDVDKGSIGGHIRYSFTRTGLGAVVRGRCNICKRGRDLTDYDSW